MVTSGATSAICRDANVRRQMSQCAVKNQCFPARAAARGRARKPLFVFHFPVRRVRIVRLIRRSVWRVFCKARSKLRAERLEIQPQIEFHNWRDEHSIQRTHVIHSRVWFVGELLISRRTTRRNGRTNAGRQRSNLQRFRIPFQNERTISLWVDGMRTLLQSCEDRQPVTDGNTEVTVPTRQLTPLRVREWTRWNFSPSLSCNPTLFPSIARK